ncbi:MAG TPA: ThuA domain-containing protein [Phycisphaerae bacterium]|nr:ThuA domain-containing protein [Phycisphaerae bacterium]HOB74652.1 ThuA domain-containing protein [Phycisphaerae bacterium]HOJ53635.1 ThuA domain-containing protein [Phycisphaerae bacterium]HOL26360.1 ThuA domain-containing protein [Phycisphaerae bacterium]HPP21131.1 ThuA domain-containing protein [Phycisphaerae bacterium]
MRIGVGLWAASVLAIMGGTVYGQADKPQDGKKRILFYSQSCGFRHSVVVRPVTGELAYAEKMLKEIAGQAGYEVDVTQDFHDLKSDNVYKKYDAVVFYTTGNPPINRNALMKFIRDGGAFIGIHTATDTFHSESGPRPEDKCGAPWPEYVRMVGAAFRTHGKQHEVVIKVEDPNHPATKPVPADWKILDEIYLFKDFSRDNMHVLLSVDTTQLSDEALKALAMERGQDYPVAWTRTEGKGRIFYTSLGHREDVWTNPVWRQHLLGGMAWALEKGPR